MRATHMSHLRVALYFRRIVDMEATLFGLFPEAIVPGEEE